VESGVDDIRLGVNQRRVTTVDIFLSQELIEQGLGGNHGGKLAACVGTVKIYLT
jgi:hypothetical protein